MKRISGPFGLPQSCAEMVRPSGVFTETALNLCSCAWAEVAREIRNAATDIRARWLQGDAQIIWRFSLIADAHAHRRRDEAAVSIRPKRSCDRQRALSLSAAQERAPVCCLLFRKDARSGAGTGLANAPRSLVL